MIYQYSSIWVISNIHWYKMCKCAYLEILSTVSTLNTFKACSIATGGANNQNLGFLSLIAILSAPQKRAVCLRGVWIDMHKMSGQPSSSKCGQIILHT